MTVPKAYVRIRLNRVVNKVQHACEAAPSPKMSVSSISPSVDPASIWDEHGRGHGNCSAAPCSILVVKHSF